MLTGGKGGQVQDPDGDRESGFDDTICPVDFEQYGQITSDTLHRVLVTPLAPGVRLTVIFDCCHCQSCSFRAQRYLTVLIEQLGPRLNCLSFIDLTRTGMVSHKILCHYCFYLPLLYWTVGLVDNVKQGLRLAQAARSLVQGGFSMKKVDDAKQLLAGAQSFFHGLAHRNEPIREGLGEEKFVEDWNTEGRDVWMFSGKKRILGMIFHCLALR
jgi:hypothetical protein